MIRDSVQLVSRLFHKLFTFSSRKWLYIPIEVATRELDGSILLACEAAAKGWGVLVGNTKLPKRNQNIPKGVLITRWVSPNIEQRLINFRKQGWIIVGWCEEGLIYSDVHEYGKQKVSLQSIEQLQLFYAWGLHHAEDLVRVLGCGATNIRVSGNPRFDLHRPDYRQFMEIRSAKVKSKFGKYILVTTKFSRFNGYFPASLAVATYKKNKIIRTPGDEQLYYGLVDFHQRGYYSFLAMISRLAQEFPRTAIVVRPHPAEKLDKWALELKKYKNVHVTRDGNVIDWIYNSELLIHNNCTTGVEAFLLGKRSISYTPVCDPRFDMFLPNSLSTRITDIDSLVENLSRGLDQDAAETGTNDKHIKIAQQYIANYHGQAACVQIVNDLESLAAKEESLVWSTPRMSLMGFLNQRLKSLRSFFTKSSVLGSKKDYHRVYINEAFAGMSFENAKSIFDDIKSINCAYKSLHIVELEKNLLCIYRQD